jgi:hypothetical protein
MLATSGLRLTATCKLSRSYRARTLMTLPVVASFVGLLRNIERGRFLLATCYRYHSASILPIVIFFCNNLIRSTTFHSWRHLIHHFIIPLTDVAGPSINANAQPTLYRIVEI